MTKWIVVAAVVAGLFYFLKKSSPSSAKNVSFEASYVLIRESGMSTTGPETSKMSLKVAGPRFSSASEDTDYRGNRTEEWQVFDGKQMHTKTLVHPGPNNMPAGSAPSEPYVSSRTPSESDLHQLRFWARSFPGDAGAGGKIAGRDTTLYQAREQLPDRTVTIQAWVDAGTGIVLKSVESIYAKQVEELLNKNSVECKDIRYGPVDEAAFLPPK